MHQRLTRITISVFQLLALSASTVCADVENALAVVNRVGNVGAGHPEAISAWKTLSSSTPEALPVLIRAIQEDKPLGANWVRAAVDQIAERSISSGKGLPVEELESLILDRDVNPRARRLAYEWLVKVDAGAEGRIVPKSLDDPSVEMRRDAVASVLKEAEGESGEDAKKALFLRALTAARDTDQIEQAFDALKELGEDFDLAKHFGFLTDWRLIGPFDNTNKGGFDVAYPPETELEVGASYIGKTGEVAWQEHATQDKYGMVDLNSALGKNMGAAAYAWTVFQSPTAQEVDFRLGSICAAKVWLNGQLLMSHEVYHSGTEIDQYRCRAKLRSGANQILLKICQNEQTEAWAQDWQFQFRVCDKVGTAVLSAETKK